MPNYPAIYDAAYSNDLEALATLMSEKGVNLNSRYNQGYQEYALSALGTFGLFTKDTLLIGLPFATAQIGGLTPAHVGYLTAHIPHGPGHNPLFVSVRNFVVMVAIKEMMLSGIAGVLAGVLFNKLYSKDFIYKSYCKNGWTVLHFAALGNSYESALYLLKQGVDHRIKDEYGRTCSDIATLSKHGKFMDALENYLSEEVLVERIRANRTAEETNDALESLNALLTQLEEVNSKEPETYLKGRP